MPDVVITRNPTRIEAAIEEALGAIALEPLVSAIREDCLAGASHVRPR